MGSHPDDKTRNSTAAPKKGRVVEDERGHNIWEGTIRTVKLTLMKTGIFSVPKSPGDESDGSGPSDELEVLDDGGGFNPYDSAK